MKTVESYILSYLVNALWQIPLVFGAAWIAARALRTAGAVAQHRVWAFGVVVQSLLPAAAALPWRGLGVYLPWATGAAQAGGGQVSVLMGGGTAVSGLHLPGAALAAIAIAWAGVSLYFAARFVYRCVELRGICREAVAVTLSGAAAEAWAQCVRRFALPAVEIATSARIFSPVALGVKRRMILLPAEMLETLPEADLRTVFAHECAHIERNDFLKNLVYELLSVPASFHPLFWLTRKEMMESREMVCDQVAATLAGRPGYAQSLLRLAALLLRDGAAVTPHAIGIFDAHTFERRLMRLAHKEPCIRPARRFALVALCVAIGTTACASALALRLHVDAFAAGATAADDSAQSSHNHTVSAAEMQDHRIGGPMPTYPAEAKKEKIQGTVVLSAVISKEGNVEHLVVVSGPKELQQSALEAVSQWTYRPYVIDGNAVDVDTTINVIYSLAN
jgi:TonB family protein